jgi:hypothetical protein
MSLHPILALDQVIDEYRDYLRTGFRVKDEPASCVNNGGEIAKASLESGVRPSFPNDGPERKKQHSSTPATHDADKRQRANRTHEQVQQNR